ncbi:hypothetical protein [Haloarchaeobius sp. FL176]|nr:hypothetical protein [Haloarchaeobius sp. FL176]
MGEFTHEVQERLVAALAAARPALAWPVEHRVRPMRNTVKLLRSLETDI